MLYYWIMILYYLTGRANFPYENLFQNPKLFQALIESWALASVIFLVLFIYIFLSKKANQVMAEVSIHYMIIMIILLILPLIMAIL
ncbi:hypothetical protein DRO64_06645 [Candidatus Bathyarchaeota archaeon]|nr:MAG: hypothetical protein DRO64_06645 [Candidatus Bathyarchaeota archaeon]